MANGPDQKELDKIKEAQKLELKENMKKNRYWINQIQNLIYYNQPLTDMLNTADAIEAVTADDIKTAANTYIGENVVISVLYPEK